MNTTSNTSNAIAALPADLADWCADHAVFPLTMAKIFLIIALLVAIVETLAVLLPKLRAAFEAPSAVQTVQMGATPAVDPVKLLEALKGLLEALKGLPAWIAIFLAGLALLWMAGQRPEICAPPGAQQGQDRAGENRTATHNSSAGNQVAQSHGNQAQPQGNAVR